MTDTTDTDRTTWPTAQPLQQAADIRRAAGDPLLADWLDATANALAWLAPYRDNEPGYAMWEAALAVARQVLSTTTGQPEAGQFCGRPDCLAPGHRFMLGSTVYTCTGQLEAESCGRFVPDTPRAPGLCASCGDARGWHSRQAVDEQPETEPTDRRERYAAAIRDTDGWVLDNGQHMIDAVMAVADAEQSDLRAQIANLRAMYDVADARTNDLIDERDQLLTERTELIRQRDQITMDTIKALPAPVDRATVEAADWFEADGRYVQQLYGHQIGGLLRRMVDEQPEAEAAPYPAEDKATTTYTVEPTPAPAEETKPEAPAPARPLLWADLLGAAPDITGGACTQCYMDRARDREHDMTPEHAHCRAALDGDHPAPAEETK